MLYSEKIIYTQISLDSFKILKRLSWFENKPITPTLNSIILESLDMVNLKCVCECCKASVTECDTCPILRHR